MTNTLFLYVKIDFPNTVRYDGARAKESSYDKTKVPLKMGYYELEEVPNPHGFSVNWYVIKGTLIGAAVPFWHDVIISNTPLNVTLNPPPTVDATA
ncbi:MAG: hypothetical protein UT02_C0019G0003 [Parcubacteria group bacterium GW2011_GWC2_38_7]|nr:MAG: hypothetical protein UT02_C0019G0003 [Parcubacteria group bacterium GW2011_GWC2_38_7]